ncbi:MAG: trypsin-like peptidase domain-containing protein [Planctomycetia bacterium]|nr:trypsin-like peptidase domain-containing protein [Planctomycetia bacterium]
MRCATGFASAVALSWLVAIVALVTGAPSAGAAGLSEVIGQVQPKIVKIYGAGGFQGLEAYQSGMLISGEGHVLTVWSYVLDTDEITVTLDDGRRFKAQLLGADPRLELAVLKVDATGLNHFELAAATKAEPGTRVLAFSNLFGVATGDEPASVQHGLVAIKSQLEARRGVFDTTYKGPVYVLDAMTNNPGAPGGALVDYEGRLLAMLGKELRNSLSNTWLNYAIPIEEMATTVDEIRTGKFVRKPNDEPNKKPDKALNLALLGIVLVPDVLERTPPFVDAVRPDSPAALAGVQPDDLVLFVNDRLVQSCKALAGELEFIDRIDAVKVTVIRGQDLVDVTLAAPAEEK